MAVMYANKPSLDDELLELAAESFHDPLLWVEESFQWGAGELEGRDGPREWQRDVLIEIGEMLRSGASLGEVIQEAVASGHGIGKSALVAWLILWAISTHEDTKGVVTANTETQLKTKTWAELAKWYRLCAFRTWFEYTATAIFSTDPKRDKTWRIDMVAWSERNTEAFAGLHNEGKRILLIFDEASAIPDTIWEVSEGALTDEDTEIIWCAFGNPTRNKGRFRECFGRLAHRWHTRQIDSRTVPGTNKKQLDKWVEDYGEDSDFVRVRVRGVFPRAGSMQLIPSDVIHEASHNHEGGFNPTDPLIMAVDVARFGDDKSVIRWRRGKEARGGHGIPKAEKFRGVDTMTLAGRVAALITEHNPDAVFVDETGIGGGVIDRLRQLGHRVIGVNFGAKADSAVDGEIAANKRAEMYLRLRNWLKAGGAIDDDPELTSDLEGIEYGYVDRKDMTGILLEKKDDAKKRGLSSPDDGDGAAITFAFPVHARNRGLTGNPGNLATGHDYDPFA